MATAILTPKNIYQIQDGIVISKNPTELIIGNFISHYGLLLEFELNGNEEYYYSVISSSLLESDYITQNQTALYLSAYLDKQTNNINLGQNYNINDSMVLIYKNWYADGFATLGEFGGIKNEVYSHIFGLQKNTFFMYFEYNFGYNSVNKEIIYNNFSKHSRSWIDLTYTLPSSASILINPSNSYLNKSIDNTFVITQSSDIETLYSLSFDGGRFYYKKESESNYTSNIFSGNSFVIPANTFLSETNYNIYASVNIEGGLTSDTEVGLYTTLDVQGTVSANSPINITTSRTVNFSWDYSAPTGTQQLAYDLDISTDGGLTWSNIADHVISSDTSATFDINTSGNIYWRVRAYNQSNIPSDYSVPVMFLNAIPPRTPVFVNVVSGSVPNITWNSEDQIAYQFQVMSNDSIIIDTGFVYTAENNLTVGEYLPNGSYIFRLRTSNMYGQLSEFAIYNYLQSINVNIPSVNYTVNTQGISFTVEDITGFDRILIKRNGISIGEFNEDSYFDRYANEGINNYTLIFINSNNEAGFAYYAIPFITKKNETLIDLNGNYYSINKRWNNRIVTQRESRIDSESVNYLGANTPEINTTNLIVRSFNVSVYDEKNILDSLLGQMLFYRGKGFSSWVVLTALSRADSWYGNEVSLNLQETQYNEAVNYEI